jgi:CHAD domain-containing protein
VAQHDLRIAAKRLRYVLETVGFCLGEPAEGARRAARDLQGVLGDLHDCDVRFAMVGDHIERSGGPRADRGLELLLASTAERRDALYASFAELWERTQRDGVWAALEAAADAERNFG